MGESNGKTLKRKTGILQPLKPDWSYIPQRNLISKEKAAYLSAEGKNAIPTLDYTEVKKVLPDFEPIPVEKIERKK